MVPREWEILWKTHSSASAGQTLDHMSRPSPLLSLTPFVLISLIYSLSRLSSCLVHSSPVLLTLSPDLKDTFKRYTIYVN